MGSLACLLFDMYCGSVRMLINVLQFILHFTFNMAGVRILSSSPPTPKSSFTNCSCANPQFLWGSLVGNLETFSRNQIIAYLQCQDLCKLFLFTKMIKRYGLPSTSLSNSDMAFANPFCGRIAGLVRQAGCLVKWGLDKLLVNVKWNPGLTTNCVVKYVKRCHREDKSVIL